MSKPRRTIRVLALASFFVVAAAQAWPLPRYISSAFTGEPGGDTGVYIWNQWVFRHELERGRSPFATDTIFALGGPADLSLHNYTVFSNLLALPLQPLLGVVAAFNVVYLINVALCGIGMFLLIRRVAPTLGIAETWLAGVLFACSPFLVARSTAHFSLAAAAALPFFLLFFHRLWAERRKRDAAGAGVCMAWAAYSDPYYAVYCVLLGAAVMAVSVVRLTATPRVIAPPQRRWIDVAGLLLFVAIVAVRWTGHDGFSIGAIRVSMRSLYTPMLVLWALGVARILMTWRIHATWHRPPFITRAIGSIAIMGVTAAVLLAPLLYALAVRATEGRLVTVPVLWRSSAPGLDLLSFLLPNPNHPLAPESLRRWIASEPGRFEENVASIPWTALIVLAVAWRLTGHRPGGLWLTIAAGAISLALGPFLRIAGFDTYIPTPWAFVRYVPLVADARMPARFAVLAILAVAVMFAMAMAALRRTYPHRQRLIVALGAAGLAAELLPAPRHLYPAYIPAVYDVIARDARPVCVLNIPFGVRDGLSSLGNFTALSQFYQTYHTKQLVGGYLSRVSETRKKLYTTHPYLGALLNKSEGRTLDDATRATAADAASQFIADVNLGYVVIDHVRSTPALQQFVISTLRLQPVAEAGSVRLYVPGGDTSTLTMSTLAANSNEVLVGEGAAHDAADDTHGIDDGRARAHAGSDD